MSLTMSFMAAESLHQQRANVKTYRQTAFFYRTLETEHIA